MKNLSQIKDPKLTLQDDCLISDPLQEECDASDPLEVDSPEPASSAMAPQSPIKEKGIDPCPKYYKRRSKKNPEVSNEGGATGKWSIALRKDKRLCVKPQPHNIAHYLTFNNVSPQYKTSSVGLQDIPIPKSPQEAVKISLWKEAMDEEMRAPLQNDT